MTQYCCMLNTPFFATGAIRASGARLKRSCRLVISLSRSLSSLVLVLSLEASLPPKPSQDSRERCSAAFQARRKTISTQEKTKPRNTARRKTALQKATQQNTARRNTARRKTALRETTQEKTAPRNTAQEKVASRGLRKKGCATENYI